MDITVLVVVVAILVVDIVVLVIFVVWLSFHGLPIGFQNTTAGLETERTSSLWSCLRDSSSILRRVIRLSKENSLVLCLTKFLNSFQLEDNLSMMTAT